MTRLSRKYRNRDGVFVPLFAFLLPVLLVLAAFAINMSQQQLTTTQLRIATDAASHAGGRALTAFQNGEDRTRDFVIDRVQSTIDRYYTLNQVNGKPLELPSDPEEYIDFYRIADSDGRVPLSGYNEDTRVTIDEARNGNVVFNGVGVSAMLEVPYAFGFSFMFNDESTSSSNFNPTRTSITKQVERDISVVIDQSASMLTFIDEPALALVVEQLARERRIRKFDRDVALGRRFFWSNGQSTARKGASIFYRRFAPRIINGRRLGADIRGPLRDFANRNPSGTTINGNRISGEVLRQISEYANSWEDRLHRRGGTSELVFTFVNGNRMFRLAPEQSRWDALVDGLEAFFDVLKSTPASEQVAVVRFSTTTVVQSMLAGEDQYDEILQETANTVPFGGTAIHTGMRTGLEEVVREGFTRPFAENTIVVMTDGQNSDVNLRREPVNVAREFRETHPELTIHTLTFGVGAGVAITTNPVTGEREFSGVMVDVAEVGGGEHFHADQADELRSNLRAIANILPTIFTF